MENRGITYKARLRVQRLMTEAGTCDVLAELLERRPRAWLQSVNTAYLAAQVLLEAEEAELSKPGGKAWPDVDDILRGALLHDAGELVLPDGLLDKPGRLTDEERAILRTHPGAGVEMLSGLGYSSSVLDIVRHHHERTDGSGYPDGMAKTWYGVRLVAVCDVYEALTAERPHRKAFNVYEASSMMQGMPVSQGVLMDLKHCPDT